LTYLWPKKWKDRRTQLRIVGPPPVDYHGEPYYATPSLEIRLGNEDLFCNCDANDLVEYFDYRGDLLAGIVLEARKVSPNGDTKSFRVLQKHPGAQAGVVRVEGRVVDRFDGAMEAGTRNVWSQPPMILIDCDFPIALEVGDVVQSRGLLAEGEMHLCDLERL
jgi:hypothetical protein